MYNTGPSKKLIAQRKAYAQNIKNIYRVLLARKSYFLNVSRQLRKEHEIKTAETASLT
jgi:hypothetical protein